MEKKPWKTPTLIILARSKPEEAVLNGCKTNLGYDGPGAAYGGRALMYYLSTCTMPACNEVVTS